MPKTSKKKPQRKKKRGRPEERLIITGDPQQALDRLLKKSPRKP